MRGQKGPDGKGKISTMSKVFIDTNILIYSIDGSYPKKREKCRALLKSLSGDPLGVISTQVMQEFFVVATKKLGLDPLVVKDLLSGFARFEIVLITQDMVFEAIDISIIKRLSFWDALIVAAAVSANCSVVWTEDLNPGETIRGVRIVNPI